MYECGEYTQKECDLVHQMILDTALVETPVGPKQIATTPLSNYLLDADLANFGRRDFFERAEAQRKEISQSEDIFYQKTLELVQVHSFFTTAAKVLRNPQKNKNIAKLQRKLVAMRHAGEQLNYYGVSLDRLGFLTQLPVLINSSLVTREIIGRSLHLLNERLVCEASTIFLIVPETNEIEFWALKGGTAELSGQRLPGGTGIAGWVINNKQSVLTNDVANDPRFFKKVDADAGFITNAMICVPLLVRGDQVIGALQLLNPENESGFVHEDMLFAEHVGRHLALSLENAQLIEKLKKQHRELALLDKRRTELSGLIAHEFRTPINVIQSAAELIAMQHENSKDRSLVRLMINGVARLVQLIDQVRDLSVSSKSDLELQVETFLLQDVFATLVDCFETIITNRKLQLVIDAPECPAVRADPALILVAIKNLLANAIRYTPDNGTIILKALPRAGMVEISVIDTGIGIAEDQVDVIFQKFYEVQSIYEHSSGTFEFKSGGLGLGLPTVQSILKAHGTSVQVDSTVGKGSRFYFSLPQADLS